MNLPKKKDPSLTYLNKLGYNVVKLPRTGIEPLDVIGRDKKSVQLLGPIAEIWKSAVPQPAPGLPKAATAVNGQKTDAMELSVGMGILKNALAAFGASAPSLDTAYKSAHAVQFSFTNVTLVSVSPFAAGNYLAKGDLATDNPVVRNYFLSGQATAWLIVEVLRSNSITVTASDSHGMEVGIDVPAIQNVLDAKIGMKPSNAANSTVTFSGPEAVTFGFAVQQIARVGDAWELHGAAPSGDIAFATPAMGGVEESGGEAPMVFETGPYDCRLEI